MALAARDSYDPADLVYFSLQHYQVGDLPDGPVPGDLDLLDGSSRDNGFDAALYRDYLGGSKDYILAYRGTETTVLADWIADLVQGIGFDSSQYVDAMALAYALDLDSLAKGYSVSYAGHSLGGGLASAASMVTGQHAWTFNAAGLHPSTLYDWWEARYPDAAVNYINNDDELVTAYNLDWDILNFLQDKLPVMLPAIGDRNELDGPYDIEIWTLDLIRWETITNPASIKALIRALPDEMLDSHSMDQLLYGLLVDEGITALFTEDLLGYEFD